MTCGLVKVICTRDYKEADDLPPDIRVFHCDPPNVERISSYYLENGYEVTTEEI